MIGVTFFGFRLDAGCLFDEQATRHHHPHRNIERDVTRHAMDSACACHQSHARFRQTETCMFRRNDNVAGQRDFASAAQGESIHRRDDRLVDVIPRYNSGKAEPYIPGAPNRLEARRGPTTGLN
jgi:hypothetical protein